MELWTAFVLGLVGSLHCAGMCGPIAMAIPVKADKSSTFLLNRIAYNAGRIATYSLLGILFGTVGKSFTVIGLQRWVSLMCGIMILAALLAGTRFSITARFAPPIAVLKNALGKLLHSPSLLATFLFGMINGFLPCGLVYAACAGATASSGVMSGASYMVMFGIGTLPMMLSIGLLGKRLPISFRFKLQRLIPCTLIVLSLLLIFRGLALGIPYLSPDLAHGGCCHR